MVKNPPASGGGTCLIPGPGKCPGEESPLQCSCLGNPWTGDTWGATVQGLRTVRHGRDSSSQLTGYELIVLLLALGHSLPSPVVVKLPSWGHQRPPGRGGFHQHSPQAWRCPALWRKPGGNGDEARPAGTTSLKTWWGPRTLLPQAVMRTLHLQHRRRATGQPVPRPTRQ